MTPLRRSWERIAAVARKELLQLIRDRLTMSFVVVVPIIQLVLFGYAINQDIRHAPTAVVDQSRTEMSRHLVGQLEATQTFDVEHRLLDDHQGRKMLQDGEVAVVVVIPPDFARRAYRGRGARVSFLVDATDPTLAKAVLAAANGLEEYLNARQQPFVTVPSEQGALRASRDRAAFEIQPEIIHGRQWEFSVLTYYNPELRTPVFVVPALLGVILTTTMLMMTALSIVRERERGTFEFLIGTPVHRFELMIGKISPYVAIGAVQIVIVLGAGLILFRVPIQGPLPDLALASMLFIAANLALGLVISSVTSNQLQATQLSFFYFLPSVLLSGFMFPFAAMPEPAQWLGELLPLTHYVRISRGILLRGAGLDAHLAEAGALLLFVAAFLALATRLFKKQVA